MAQKTDYAKYVAPIGGLLLAYYFGSTILEKLGLIKSAAANENESTLLPGSPLYPQFWHSKGGALILTVSAAQAYAELLKKSKGLFNDDESAVYGVFQNMKTQSQVSFLADTFQSMYGVSLAAYLLSFLDEDEMQKVLAIIKRLPAYFP